MVIDFVGSLFSHYRLSFGFAFGILSERGFALFPLGAIAAQPTLNSEQGASFCCPFHTKYLESPFFLQKPLPLLGYHFLLLIWSPTGPRFQLCSQFVFPVHRDIYIVFKHGCVFSVFSFLCFTIHWYVLGREGDQVCTHYIVSMLLIFLVYLSML